MDPAFALLGENDVLASTLERRMDVKLIGWLLLLSGWFIVLATLAMLPAGLLRAGFLLAGAIVECLGLALLTYGYTIEQRRSE